MKASELISRLQRLIYSHGDIDVWIEGEATVSDPTDVMYWNEHIVIQRD